MIKKLLACIFFFGLSLTIQAQDELEKAYNYFNQKSFNTALIEIDNYLTKNPNSSSAIVLKCEILLEQEKFEQAMYTLNKGIKAMPDSAELYGLRGSLGEAMRFYDDAIADFSKAFELSTDNKSKCIYLSNRGGTRARVRDFYGAYEDLKKSIELDPDNLEAINNLAAVCDEVGKPEETIYYLELIIEKAPEYGYAYINLGYKQQLNGDHKKALESFNKAEELTPNDPLIYSNRAFTYLNLGDTEKAMLDINKSLKHYPSNSYAYKIRALIYLKTENKDEACKDLFEAIDYGYTQQYGEEVKDLILEHCE